MKELTINNNDSGQRLDKFLLKTLNNIPKPLLYKYIRLKCIKINGKKAVENDILHQGDRITFYINEEFFAKTPERELFLKTKSDITVAYEDKNIIIAEKPAGLIVHSDEGEDVNTLINKIKMYLFSKGEYDYKNENSFSPALCNRIDRNTSGLVVAAKNSLALKEMNQIIKQRKLTKLYLAVINGIPSQKSGTITGFINKNEKSNTVTVSASRNSDNDKTAITNYKILKANQKHNISLAEVELITGRTHQIRAHFAFIGHPLVGDGKYFNKDSQRLPRFKHQALCAYSLEFKTDGSTPLLHYLNNKKITAKQPEFIGLFE